MAVARLSSVDFVGLAARWLEDERNARAVAAAAGRAIPCALDIMPKGAIDEWVALAARRGIEAVPAAPLASRGLSILWAQGAGQTLLDQGLDFVETTLERHKATIVRRVAQKSWRWIPKWVDDMIAAKVINGLTETLREMRDPDHPWREQANALIENLIDNLAHGPEMRAQGSAGWQPPPAPSADGSKRTLCVGRGSIGGSGSWRCALSCLAEPKSAPISPRWSTTGTPRRSSTAWNCKSARTCNISASTGRWSGS
ncbi:MAG TPA: DUF445 family protein [Roseiarcus sp.]|nr:DUF445 family protein [Roseiarcus sp.]